MKALICGISGQDGAYLAQHLLSRGYEVFGTSRDAQTSGFGNLRALDLREGITTLSMSPTDFRSVLQTLTRIQPDEVYNLSGQSSVGLSFEQPVEAFESISVGTLNLLEAIRFAAPKIRFYNAGSGEVFGDTGDTPADEDTRLAPKSPYAVAKATAQWTVASYRDAYKLHCCSGILFNHESALRPERFVTRKIVAAACAIKNGDKRRLRLGNIEIVRDWGWAPEYVHAMHLMLQQPTPADYVIASGKSFSLQDFVELVFAELGLTWRDHVDLDATLLRPSDHRTAKANPARVAEALGWRARYNMPDVARMMVRAELALRK
jgi:GDPmannose 4,6-dehydratase